MAIEISFSYITPTIRGTPMSNSTNRDSSRSGMANQNPGQQKQSQDKSGRQQGDTMDPGSRGGHRPSGGDANLDSDRKNHDRGAQPKPSGGH